VRQCSLDSCERRLELGGHARRVDRRPRGQRHDGEDRHDVAPVAVEGLDRPVRLEPLPARYRAEVVGERVGRRPEGGDARDRHDKPEADNRSLVPENPASPACHGLLRSERYLRCTCTLYMYSVICQAPR
jgi:hypothetical protein